MAEKRKRPSELGLFGNLFSDFQDNLLLAAWWKDRNGVGVSRRQRQLVQVVATVKRIRLRIRVRIEIDLRTQDADVRLAVRLVPATATRRNERLEARR